jgi:hypothetical protein
VESFGLMSTDASQFVIGYSVFDTSEECYEYNENACMIASTLDGARRILRDAMFGPEDAEFHPVFWNDLLRDYGCSSGEYAMEADAFARFHRLAQQYGVLFEAEAYDGDDSLMVVEIDSRFLTPDSDR